jgi:tape measure domain-containing protein
MDAERIVLDVDDRPAVAGSKRANAAIAEVEGTADRAVDKAMAAMNADGQRLVRFTERSKASINQITSAVERKALAAGRSPLEQLTAQQSRDLGRVAGDPAAVDRVTASYARLIEVQKRADFVSGAEKARAASERAAAGTRQFEQALIRTNKELDRQKAAAAAAAAATAAGIEKEVVAIEHRAAALGRSKLQQITSARDTHLAGLTDPGQVNRVTAAYNKLIEAQVRSDEVQRRSDATAKLERQAASAAAFGRVMSVVVTGGMLLAAGASLQASEQFESSKRAFTQFEGSAEKAVATLGRFERFALQTPFEFAELIPAAQRMRALGFASNEVIPILRAVGDQVAGFGGGKEQIDRITLALVQMQAKTKVSAEEIRQLAESGVRAWEPIRARSARAWLSRRSSGRWSATPVASWRSRTSRSRANSRTSRIRLASC